MTLRPSHAAAVYLQLKISSVVQRIAPAQLVNFFMRRQLQRIGKTRLQNTNDDILDTFIVHHCFQKTPAAACACLIPYKQSLPVHKQVWQTEQLFP